MESVLLLDADFGLANIDDLLGLRPRLQFYDVIKWQQAHPEVILNGLAGISIIPAASGVEEMCNLDIGHSVMSLWRERRIEVIAIINYDYLLINIYRQVYRTYVLNFRHASNEKSFA